MTSYELIFDRRALKEWRKLDAVIRGQFKRKLARALLRPRIPANRLHGPPDCYKIKLRGAGYRLIYQVRDREVQVFVIAIGACDKARAYQKAGQGMSDSGNESRRRSRTRH